MCAKETFCISLANEVCTSKPLISITTVDQSCQWKVQDFNIARLTSVSVSVDSTAHDTAMNKHGRAFL